MARHLGQPVDEIGDHFRAPVDLAEGLPQRLVGVTDIGEQIDHDLTGAQARALRQREVERAGAISHGRSPCGRYRGAAWCAGYAAA